MLLSVPPLLRGVLEARQLDIDQPVVRLRVDDAPHIGSWNLDPDRYETEIASFLSGL